MGGSVINFSFWGHVHVQIHGYETKEAQRDAFWAKDLSL